MTFPEIDRFKGEIEALRGNSTLSMVTEGTRLRLGSLSLPQVADLLKTEAGHYFLIAAAGLNRTSLRKAMLEPEAQVVAARQRRAYAVASRLPVLADFGEVSSQAMALRRGDLQRRARGQIEQLFRDRLKMEGIPLLMSPPVRVVPGALIGRRKPDGVWPDPATGLPPRLYLEIKNIRRVSDDIQKRLYELAEASIEMKLLYSSMTLRGLALNSPSTATSDDVRGALRAQILGQYPIVVGLLLCSRAEADRYRSGAHAFIDQVFFSEEIDDCLTFLRKTILEAGGELGS